MKFCTFAHNGVEEAGLVVNGGIVPLSRLNGGKPLSMRQYLEHPFAVTIDAAVGAQVVPMSAVRLRPPVPDPGKIVCVGTNYEEHRLETERPPSARPVLFLRVAESLASADEALLMPAESADFDYEGEIALVIGKGGRRIPEESAYEHVFGYACFNDGSVRDWQRHTTQFTAGKNFDATGAFGPFLVTADEAGDPAAMLLETRLNGEIVQSARGSDMIFSIPEIIAYVSSFSTLRPGDVIVTGTPGGVGFKRQPPLFMRAGDSVEVAVSGLGTLVNTVAAG